MSKLIRVLPLNCGSSVLVLAFRFAHLSHPVNQRFLYRLWVLQNVLVILQKFADVVRDKLVHLSTLNLGNVLGRFHESGLITTILDSLGSAHVNLLLLK